MIRLSGYFNLLHKQENYFLNHLNLINYKCFDKQMQTKSHSINRSLYWFYNHKAIDATAAKPSVRLPSTTMLYAGKNIDGSHLLSSAKYLRRELPIRIAQQVISFRNLPFIIGCNPSILGIHELYINAFYSTYEFNEIVDFESEKKYLQVLKDLLDNFKDVINKLADGFRECRKHIKNDDMIQAFLNKTLTSRLGMRLLAEHHLGLHSNRPNFVGNINVSMKPKELIEKWCKFVQNLSEIHYGKCPPFHLNGHLDATLPYFETPLDYIIPELLKNSVRATIEAHPNSHSLPAITITIAKNDIDFIIRISDRGGGIPHDLMDLIFKYNFSTAEEETIYDNDAFGRLVIESNKIKMHGYGFGLPTSRVYADYLGGSLRLKSMQGIGTDVYLRLARIDGKYESFRI